MVMIYHYGSRYDGLFGHAQPIPFDTEWGYFGVHLFFMISGYAILLTARRTADAGTFLANRAARLYPAFWAGCLLTFVVVRLFGLPEREVSWWQLLLNFSMFPSQLAVPMVDGVYWTLRVEWVFYAVVAVLLALKRGNLTTGVLTLLVGLDALGLSVGKFFAFFLVGVCAFETAGQRPAQCTLHALALALCAKDIARHNPPEIVVMLLGFGVLVFLVARRSMPWLANPVLVFAGTISYPLYLLHQNIGYVALRESYARGASTPVALVVATGVVVALSVALTFGVERPLLGVWRKRQRSRSVSPAQPPSPGPAGGGVTRLGE